ncbi:MAG: hypothetical protein GWN58_49730, partial [Anaerolineae bacterium]|nr:hypothetical protein [Anaerolineae bacterium]
MIDAAPGNNDMPGAILFKTAADGEASNDPAERMRIDSSGNVGIGDSSPSHRLSVYEEDGHGDATMKVFGSTNAVTLLLGAGAMAADQT